jgi:hypothetical protein
LYFLCVLCVLCDLLSKVLRNVQKDAKNWKKMYSVGTNRGLHIRLYSPVMSGF